MSVARFPAKEGWMCSDIQLLERSPSVPLILPAFESCLCCYGESQVKGCT